ncbi:MAG: DEAD/DEAH box helicase family protein [Roseburia sp.]
MKLNEALRFKGNWRAYQARVLQNANRYLADGRIHIVAAPGSGKTTLGIELMARIGKNALVLAPSITIREQWAQRIAEAFLCDGVTAEEYLSQDLKQPKAITIVTYQALHSAMTGYRGTLKEDASGRMGEVGEKAEDATEKAGQDAENEMVDFSNFDLISVMRRAEIGVLCLDECHHLRSEWWKALEDFREKYGNLTTIALTATPPYDSTPAMWNRYINMCGEIDEEITIPELVKEGSLCPHQDFVYLNYPTREEQEEIARFAKRSEEMQQKLMQDSEFAAVVASHSGLNGKTEDDVLLEEPSYLAALLIFLKAKGMPYPIRLQKLLGASALPPMEAKWLEILLQKLLYEDTESFSATTEYREKLSAQLKAEGLVEKRKVCLTVNDSVEKLLTQSKGKCNSIREIVAHEYRTLGENLRLLLLTDYIRREYEKALGDPETDVMALGVLPFFEQLRREQEKTGSRLRLGVLCGTVVIIPAEAKEALEQAVEGIGKVTFGRAGNLQETDYLKVTAVGKANFLTGAVTNLFAKGYMQVLIGTKSLLGEGWDSPCINSLILASFVGSFMLSNQMRGRAIRVWKENPEKTSNIWHLVCLRPWDEVKKDTSGSISEDYELLARRMEHFLGLHYTEDIIESGMERLSIIKPPFNNTNVSAMNQQSLKLSAQRETLRERWMRALTVHKNMEVAEELAVEENTIPKAMFRSAIRGVAGWAVCGCAALAAAAMLGSGAAAGLLGTCGGVAIGIALLLTLRAVRLSAPYRRLKSFGNGIRKGLLSLNLLEDSRSRIVAETGKGGTHSVYMAGGSGRDKALFAQCIREFFAPVDNQRYLLVKQKNHRGADGFFCVPECFAKKKEDALRFAECMKPHIGSYDAVYTRNESGRALLLEGRSRALANRRERCTSHRRVKGALE